MDETRALLMQRNNSKINKGTSSINAAESSEDSSQLKDQDRYVTYGATDHVISYYFLI